VTCFTALAIRHTFGLAQTRIRIAVPWFVLRGDCNLDGVVQEAGAQRHRATPGNRRMRQYKLTGWPELAGPYQRTAYRRMLSDMSHRYMSMAALVQSSGATKLEVRQFLQVLDDMGVLIDREDDSDSFFDTTIRPVGEWLRTVFGSDQKIL
jgi:hypothetical protein